MHILRLTLAIVVLLTLCAGACSAYNPGDPEFRAIFVSAWSVGCRNSAEIDQLVANAHACNANTIVAQMRRRGDTFYPSPYEPWATGIAPGFDALAYLVQKCHSTSPRLDVQAWFVVWPIASSGAIPSNPNHPYNRYPQYLTKTDTGSTDIGGEYWFDPGNPNAEQYTYNVMMDVVNRYDVDGINLDYIRYAYDNIGYNDVSVARFNARYGRTGLPSSADASWRAWRRDQVTNFVRKVYANAIAVKPNMKVTADVFCSTPAATSDANWPAAPAYNRYFQDWRAWMEEGIVDLSNPMSYFDCTGDYASYFGYWTCFSRSHQYNRQTAMTISITGKGTDCAVQQMLQARQQSCPGVPSGAGMSIYSYSSIDQSMLNAMRSVWTTSAPVPAMTWKTAPTKGHIMGNVTFAGTVWIDGATISLTGAANRSMIADGTGFFAFIDLPHGDYTVTCNANGYGVATNNVHVDVGQVVSADCDFPLSTLIISNVVAGGETGSGATITWNTNAASSSKVYYGQDRTCSSSTTEDATQVTSHSVTLGGLSPGTTYFYRVYSLNSGAPAAMSPVYALVTTPARPADFIVESRSPGLNYGNFSFNGPTTSSAKSTASGLTSAIGCYYAGQTTPAKWGQWSYTPTMSGRYNVYGTWATNAYASGVPAPIWTVENAGALVTIPISQTAGGNAWNLLTTGGDVQLNSGVAYAVRLTTNADNVSNKRTYFDSVKFAYATETTPPSTPSNLAPTNVQDDSITIGWTASTDNVGIAGYRISRGLTSTVNVVDSSPTNSYTDNDILANTRYWYAVSAYDTSGNKSGTTSTINFWSSSPKPTTTNVTCDKQAGEWQTAGPFVFTAVGGFGPGKVNYYRYAWDTSPSHTWTGTESTWVGGTKSCATASGADPYYLHIMGYNQAAVAGEYSDLGPYYLDTTGPGTPSVTDDGGYTPSQTSVHASWISDEPESGLIGYQYAVGTTSGGTNLVNWTTTTDADATMTIPSQPYGTMLYVSVKAQNGAHVWSSVGTADGIRVARSVATVADAKALDNTGIAVYLENKYVSAVFATCFYVQDAGRSPGIRVEGSCPYAVGAKVNVGGILGKNAANERNLTSATVTLAP